MRYAALAVVSLLLAANPALGQDESRERDQFFGSIRVSGMFFDNFFQAPDGEDREGVLALSTEARVAARPDRGSPHTFYVEADRIGYQDFGPAAGITGGFIREGRPHSFDLSAGYHWNRPTFEVGDFLDRADAFRLDGRYEYRVDDDWQAGASAYFQAESYELTPDKENDLLGGALSLRYRGFGRGFQPEVGLGAAKRDVLDDREDYNQREVWIRVRSRLSSRTSLGVRYRYRKRDYDVLDPRSLNFQREDKRHQITVSADRRLTERLAANLYYAFEASDSTRASRTFDAHLLALGVTVSF